MDWKGHKLDLEIICAPMGWGPQGSTLGVSHFDDVREYHLLLSNWFWKDLLQWVAMSS